MIKNYSVKDMNCASCASNVEHAASQIQGVKSAEVNLLTENLQVDFHEYNEEIEQTMMQAVSHMGYGIVKGSIVRTRILIGGMHCASCSANVEKTLKAQEGIIEAFVNLTTEQATIEYNPEQIKLEQIYESIENLGYQVILDEKNLNESAEQKKAKRKLYSLFSFAIPLFLISMGPMLGIAFIRNLQQTYPIQMSLLQLLLTVPILIIARDHYRIGFKSLASRMPNMDSLVAVGTSAAFIYSLVNTVRILQNGISFPLYFESVGVIIALINLGKYLEGSAKRKTGKAIERLTDLRPKTAFLIEGQSEKEILIQKVKPGDHLLVKPGSAIPTDGKVLTGESSVDESMISGESIPVFKSAGDHLTGASVNGNGSMVMEATKVGEDTILFQIIRMVREAQGSKAPIARLADKVAGRFVPIVMSIAVLAFIFWMAYGKNLEFSLTIFVAVLVIACPCALGLATPTAIMVGTGRAAEKGILFKGGEPLERLNSTQVMVFDKTGTITQGKPTVNQEFVYGGYSVGDLYTLASLVESRSEHPLADAVIKRAEEIEKSQKWTKAVVENVKSIQGKGIAARVSLDGKGYNVWMGSLRMLEEKGFLKEEKIKEDVNQLQNKGNTIMALVLENEVVGLIGAKDRLKDGIPQMVRQLKELGIRAVLLTGDHKTAADHIAKEAGIDTVIAEVLPEHKVEEVERLQKEGYVVTMVGDGINDAPALVQADVGMAVGGGTDVAVESADVVLMQDDPMNILVALRASSKTIRNIKQNLFWAFFYNMIGIPIAAGVLYTSTGLLLNPMIAAAAMAFSSVSVVSNALRLRKQI
ncbi:copper-translocating P-type ATPase [Clostridia bacterium]|nr:copper-translocating P-type ATPase [Clostridia bacterium]